MLVAARPRDCTSCRLCIEEENGGDSNVIELSKVKDHFIFTIESIGCLLPHEIFIRSIEILKKKCDKYKGAIQKHNNIISNAANNMTSEEKPPKLEPLFHNMKSEEGQYNDDLTIQPQGMEQDDDHDNKGGASSDEDNNNSD